MVKTMKLNKVLRLKTKEFLLGNQKDKWRFPLLVKKSKGILGLDAVEKCKLINNEAYLILKRERFLQGLSRK